ncbi:MAG: RAMP superfamily CRISPR-associated protein [Thermostichus sp. DG02_2_bins_29]
MDLVHQAETRADYGARLQTLNQRTKRIAGEGNTFEVRCPWRIRVGGTKGPESMLLPAFDHLGIPYIPSSTLRGVARAQAIREKMQQEHLSWQEADKAVAPFFGHLDARKEEDCAGKVVFLDAYPVPKHPQKPGDPDNSKSGGLAVDISNNIWSWDGDSLKYSPNPNVFFSLKQVTFLIGIRKGLGCTDEIFSQVKAWLIQGLEEGIGSQINSGYGRLIEGNASRHPLEFLRLPFELEGQLIHGRQQFTEWRMNQKNHQWQHRGKPEPEVRPVAFKNMLRYWFRAFGLGVLPVKQVQEWEAKLFGAITPEPKQGWIRVEILEGKVLQENPEGKNDLVGRQEGILVLSLSGECPADKYETAKTLFLNLTWMMFHLGGVGQGARRPCYSHKDRPKAPWCRGSTLIPKTQDYFWGLPESAREFQGLFCERLRNYFAAMQLLLGNAIDAQNPRAAGNVTREKWTEAVDANCRIVVCSGESDSNKPYALSVLHQLGYQGEGRYDKFLCGVVQGGAVPSPVWISDLDDYQVVTVFGATESPRREYLQKLEEGRCIQIWPLKSK